MLTTLKSVYTAFITGTWIEWPRLVKIAPYLRLMRLHQPAGALLVLWPAWWSITLNSKGLPSLGLLLVFALGAVAIRGAGCIINDILDRDIDKNVERTKSRPLASGELSVKQAIRLLVILGLIGLLILAFLPPVAQLISVLAVVPIAIYPLMKRITYWPQLVLGLTFNLGALIGGAAITNNVSITSLLVYFGTISWTIAYDTIYAHQDKKDDSALGVKSTALKFGKKTPKYVAVFYQVAVIFWGLAGMTGGTSLVFFIFWLAAAYHMYLQIVDLDLDDPASCAQTFKSNSMVGLLIFAAAVAGKAF